MQQKKNFISNFLVIGSSTAINMVISFFTTPIITRLVDPEAYGQIALFNMYCSIAVMVLCLGLDQSLVRFFYEKDSIAYKSRLLHICIKYPVIISLPLLFTVCVLSYHHVINFEFSSEIVFLLCIDIFISVVNRMALLILRLTYQSNRYAICNIMLKAIYVATVLILIFTVGDNYFLLMAIATIVSISIPTIYAIASSKSYWNFRKNNENINKKIVLKYGFPMIFSMGITQLFQALDKISLNMYRTYEEVGIYSSAMSIVSVFALIQSTFNALWSPMQVEHYTKHPEDTHYISRMNQYITVVMFFLGFSLIVVKDLFALLLGPKFREAAYIMPFLIFNPIMYTISETTCSGIEKSKKSYLNIIVALIACATNFVGNSILVPILGGKGAAISTGISYIVFWIARTLFSNKYYYINYHTKKFFIITLVAVGFAAYNTFFRLSGWSVLLYFVSILMLILLYHSDIMELFGFCRQYISNIKSQRNR